MQGQTHQIEQVRTDRHISHRKLGPCLECQCHDMSKTRGARLFNKETMERSILHTPSRYSCFDSSPSNGVSISPILRGRRELSNG